VIEKREVNIGVVTYFFPWVARVLSRTTVRIPWEVGPPTSAYFVHFYSIGQLLLLEESSHHGTHTHYSAFTEHANPCFGISQISLLLVLEHRPVPQLWYTKGQAIDNTQ